MKEMAFTKLTGAGNDFVIIDNRERLVRNAPALARRVCDRRFGVGADGLILVETSRIADYRMMYYNADGSFGGMCGNGGRCVARFAFAAGIADAGHRFEALAHVYEARVGIKTVRLKMKNVTALSAGRRIRIGESTMTYSSADTGSPHIVLPVKRGTLIHVAVEGLGARLRRHRTFSPQGTNVNFMQREGKQSIRMRTYERGVEAETLACGTGSIACALTAHELWGMKSPVNVITRSNRSLRVGFRKTADGYENVTLEGPAEIVFAGIVHA